VKENANVLVIGEHNVGKTNYGIQLLGRLRTGRSRLTLRGTPDTIAPFEAGLTALNNGKAPDHTPTATNHQLLLPIAFNQAEISVAWPDYGGEQISEILTTRTVSESWKDRITHADGWMLFLRLNAISESLDALQHPAPKVKRHKPRATMVSERSSDETAKQWNPNAKIIELLQILLHVKRIGIHKRVQLPALTVALSCWDELPVSQSEKPLSVLKERLPLLYDFMVAIWEPNYLSIFGVSALGTTLDSASINTAFRDEGPEQHGFVIMPDGSKTSDLAEPVLWLMERMQ
jgi:Double-GTPase 1